MRTVCNCIAKHSQLKMSHTDHRVLTGVLALNAVTCGLCFVVMVGTIQMRHRVNALESILGLHPTQQSPQKLPPQSQPPKATNAACVGSVSYLRLNEAFCFPQSQPRVVSVAPKSNADVFSLSLLNPVCSLWPSGPRPNQHQLR